MEDQVVPTLRQRQKADRRDLLLLAAKRLMAKHGYTGVRLEDLGAAAGISGPAVYRHFPGKDAVLVELLVGISRSLLAGGQEIVAAAPSPAAALRGLVESHVQFAFSEPELILIYDRDRYQLPADALADVRRTQRRYLEIWIETIAAAEPSGDPDVDRLRAHAVFGLINSTPRNHGSASSVQVRETLTQMALAALQHSVIM